MPLSSKTSLRARWLGCLVAACCVLGCARPSVPVARSLPAPTLVDRLPEGSTLALPRPTPGVARLSLWIGTGSRDAQPAQLATAAGWLVAERALAHARVEAETTELTLLCDVAQRGLKTCVAQLGAALSRSDVSEADALRLRERLRSTRLRALSDPARVADERAILGLLGEEAHGFFPLGQKEKDAEVSADLLSKFLRAHLRPELSLLIAAGDVDDRELESSYAPFRSNKRLKTGATRTNIALNNTVQIDEGNLASLTFAVAASDPTLAAGVGEQMQIMYPGAVARIARVTGFTLLSVKMPTGKEPFARLQRAAFDLRRLALELSSARVVPRDDTLEDLTHEIGERWAHRDDRAQDLTLPWPMSVVVTLPPEQVPKSEVDLNARRARLEQSARQAVAAGERNAFGPIEGNVDTSGASVRLPNGVGIEVTQRAGDRWLSALIRFDQGAGEDPEPRHGRAALLATWLSDGCGFAQAQSLDAHLHAIDARIAPLVSADETGVRIVAPREHWERALDTLLRCAVRPSYGSRSIEDARARLLGSLLGQERALYAAFAARVLSPATPGFVASWGTPLGVSAVSASELRRLHTQLVQGAHLSIAIAVDAEPERVARFAARRLAQLPQAQPLPQSQIAPASDRIIGEQVAVPSLRAVLGLRVDGDALGELAPQVVAQELSVLLSRRLGQVRWHEGRGEKNLSFSAVALALTESELSKLEGVTQEILRELDQRPDERWRSALGNAEMERGADASGAEGWARAAFERRPRVSVADELDSIRQLLRAKPRFAVLRPKP